MGYKTAHRWKMTDPAVFTSSALWACPSAIAAVANRLASSNDASISSALVSLLP
jgi:hypothetical protein